MPCGRFETDLRLGLALCLFLLGSLSALTDRYVQFHHVPDWRKLFRGVR